MDRMNVWGRVTQVESIPSITHKLKQRRHLRHGEGDTVNRKFIEAVARSDPRRERQLYRLIRFDRASIRPAKEPIVPAGWRRPEPYRFAISLSIFNNNSQPPSTVFVIDIA